MERQRDERQDRDRSYRDRYDGRDSWVPDREPWGRDRWSQGGSSTHYSSESSLVCVLLATESCLNVIMTMVMQSHTDVCADCHNCALSCHSRYLCCWHDTYAATPDSIALDCAVGGCQKQLLKMNAAFRRYHGCWKRLCIQSQCYAAALLGWAEQCVNTQRTQQ